MIQITSSAVAMTGGAATVAGVGKAYRFTFGGTWATGDYFAVTLTNALTGLSNLLGAGTVTGIAPTFAFTFNEKMNLLAGNGWYFCDLNAPTVWNDPLALGNSFIPLADNFATPENAVALAPYQGRVAVIGRRLCQIWSVDPDPANYQRGQRLPNIGTMAKRSVQAVGDMDVYMLADNGVRSLRVRDASNNAMVTDIGSPIDSLIVSLLATLTDAEKAAACGTVEPTSNRYWLYIPGHSGAEGKIYVFSYFPTSGVAAWSTYRATYNVETTVSGFSGGLGNYTYTGLVVGQTYTWSKGSSATQMTNGSQVFTTSKTFIATATTAPVTYNANDNPPFVGSLYLETPTVFTPTQFAVYNGQVYARAGDDIFLYGGTDNQTYDPCGVTWDSPFLNAKSPATRKTYHGVDCACEGNWQVSLGTKPSDANALTLIYDGVDSTFERGLSLAAKMGTHFKFRGLEYGSGYARFSGAIVHFNGGDEK